MTRSVKRTVDAPDDATGNLALGMIVGGALGLLAGIALSSSRGKLVVGGIDLSNADLTRPFFVDFGGPDPRSNLQRLYEAMAALGQHFPTWVLTPLSLPDGEHFRLSVDPTPTSMQGAVLSRVLR